MEQIIVSYWIKQKIDLIESLPHGITFYYSIEKRNEIIQTIIDNNLSIMIRPNMNTDSKIMCIVIDTKGFRQ